MRGRGQKGQGAAPNPPHGPGPAPPNGGDCLGRGAGGGPSPPGTASFSVGFSGSLLFSRFWLILEGVWHEGLLDELVTFFWPALTLFFTANPPTFWRRFSHLGEVHPR